MASGEGSNSVALSRGRREKKDKKGRFAALEKLKDLKGSKNKYSVDTVNNLWDEVDEKEYSKRVRDRQDDDWIVDDDGSGYVEDGREIFDDDIVDNASSSKRGKGDSKRIKNQTKDNTPKSNDIKRLFQAMPMKKKKVDGSIKLEGDSCLDAILQDLHKKPTNMPSPITPTIIKKKKTGVTTPMARPEIIPQYTPTRMRSNRILHPRTIVSSMPSPEVEIKSRQKPKTIKEEIVDEPMEESELVLLEAQSFPIDDDFDDAGMSDSFMLSQAMEISQTDVEVKKAAEELQKLSYDEKILSQLEHDKDRELLTAPIQEIIMPAVNCDKLPLKKNDNGEDVLHFFWIDAYEDQMKKPGTVYLFGKVQMESNDTYVSCCLIVKNIERQIFILPREKRVKKNSGEITDTCVSMTDVYTEVDTILSQRLKIQEYKSKTTKKKYCFGKTDVPTESDYLEVKYSASYPEIQSDLSGETFSHVFGANTSCLEILLLNRKIRGPCWLEIKYPQTISPPVSWCKLEVVIQRMEFIEPIRNTSVSPPISVLSLSIQTVVSAKNKQTEIVSAVGLSHNKYYLDKACPKPLYQNQFCVVSKPSDSIFPFNFRDKLSTVQSKVEVTENERALISLLITKIFKLDPDVIVGHDVTSFDLDVLLHRISTNKVPNWSRLGKLRRAMMPQQSGTARVLSAISGRLVCDTKLSAKELIQSKSYDLCELSEVVLGKSRMNISSEQAKLAFNNSEQLLSLISHNLKTSLVNLEILAELNILPLATQITTIAGNVLSRTLVGGRSERNEFLLLHAFTEKSFIVPDKATKRSNRVLTQNQDDGDASVTQKNSNRKKPTYAGGLVLDPKKGFYDKYVLLMDFNSLYPSIIQEYNICFTTVPEPEKTNDEELDENDFILPESGTAPGVLPVEIRKLVESRRQVKNLLKAPNLSPDLKLQYEIRQKALKLMANSMYGCLGFSNARFYAKHLAAMVTGFGRKILMQTKDLVEKQMNLEVIYGDTDSLMINTNCCDYSGVIKTGTKIKSEVNKLYRCLEIDTDAIFKSVLLLKKKKYAALKISKDNSGSLVTVAEIKGLDVVRRDWSQIACESGRYVIDQLLSDKQREDKIDAIISHLEKLAEQINQNEVSVDKLTITKQLTKNPEAYTDKKGFPHVNVALRLNSKREKKFRQGDTVSYIISQDGSNLPATQRAYHLDELQTNDSLKIDTVYYLAHQIHPVISRICNPIEELDAARIASCLGLEASNYKSTLLENEADDATLGGWTQMSDEEKYKDCARLHFDCPGCKQRITVEKILNGEDLNISMAIARCTTSGCTATPTAVYCMMYQNLIKDIRGFIKQYYRSFTSCDLPECGFRSHVVSLSSCDGKLRCPMCGKGRLELEFSASRLHNQLCYFSSLFDIEKTLSGLQPTQKGLAESLLTKEDRSALSMLKRSVDKYLKINAYNYVDLNQLFG